MPGNSKLSWYASRLKAMSPGEVVHRLGEKWKHRADAGFAKLVEPVALGDAQAAFPALPDPARAPAKLRARLATDAKELLNGDWLLYGWRRVSTAAGPSPTPGSRRSDAQSASGETV